MAVPIELGINSPDALLFNPQQCSERFITDIQNGFQITDAYGNIQRISVTRNMSDFFHLTAFSTADNSFPQKIFEIRRRKKIGSGKGTATKERFVVTKIDAESTTCAYYINEKKGGKLTELEFLQRYISSIHDEIATQKLKEFMHKEGGV